MWIAATLVFLIIALATLTKNGLWHDEWIKQHEFSQGSQLTREGHSLHYAIGSAWARIAGVAPFALRFPWAIFAAGCIPLGYVLARQMGDRRLARASCILLAASPYLLFYAQDANYYAEMMFYSLLAAVAYESFLTSGRPAAVAVGLASLALLYLVQPFGAVYGAALTAGLLPGALALPTARNGLIRLIKVRGEPAWRLIAKALILAGFAFAVVWFRLASRLAGEGLQFLRQFHFGGSYTNVAFNPRFFAQTLAEFGPSIVHARGWATLLGWLYAVIALAGTVELFRRRPWSALMFSLVFAASGAVVFCFKIDRFFHVRYLSFLVPLYLLGVANGLHQIGGLCERLFPRIRSAWSWPLLALLALAAPFYWRHLTFDGAYLKKVEAYLAPRLTPADRVVTYEMAGDRIPVTPPGVAPEEHVQMPYLPRLGQGWLDDAFFKQTAAREPAIWLLHHWNDPRTIHPPLLAWADQWMKRVVEAPSIYEPGSIQRYNERPPPPSLPVMMAILHRWEWPDRYVVAPRPFELDLAHEAERPRMELKRELGLIDVRMEDGGRRVVWKSPFLFEQPGNYRFAVSPEPSLRTSLLEARLNGRRLEDGRGQVETNRNEIELIFDVGEGPDPTRRLVPLSISPDFRAGFTINPFFFELPGPRTQWLLGDDEGGRPRLIFKRNLAVSYPLMLAEKRRYQIQIEAIEDRPEPVLLDVLIDGAPRALLAFDRTTNAWGRRELNEEISAGMHELTVTFLSEMDVMAQDPDADSDLILGGIEIKSAREGARDDRLNIRGKLVPAGGVRPGFAGFVAPNQLTPGWQLAGDARLSIEPDRPDEGATARVDPEAKVLVFDLAAGAQGAQLVTPPLAVVPGQYLYFDCDVQTDAEGRHSTNILIQYFDADRRPLGSRWARGTDVNAPAPWARYAYFGTIPDRAAYAALAFSFYGNSRVGYPPQARFYYRRFRIIDSIRP